MKRPGLLLILIIAIGPAMFSQSGIYNVRTEIKSTGKSILITEQIQKLIDKCYEKGGGVVYFPAGEYLTGSLILKDNTIIELGPGATLYGSTDIRDYTEDAAMSLIYAKGSENIGIRGHGVLNGNGDFFWKGKERPYIRPDRFILFEECRNIRVEGISMLNSPNWNLEIKNCDFAWFEGITMISPRDSPNTDGIDPVSSSNVFISNCYFDLGDDAICPKSRGTKPTENMVVENCIIRSDDSAIKLGTRSEAPIRNLVFNNIIIKDTQYGIAFFAKDGGVFENIRFSNISIEGSLNEVSRDDKPSGSYPLFLDIERRKPEGPLTSIENIYFSDITINSRDGHCLFLGQPDRSIKNLNFSNISFNLKSHRTLEGSKKPRGVRSLTDRAANDYSHIASNFSFAYIDGLRISNLKINDTETSGKYERHMIWGYEVHDVSIVRLINKQEAPNKDLSLIHLKESSGISISQCVPEGHGTPFLTLEGSSVRDVTIWNNNFDKISDILEPGSKVVMNEIKEFNNVRNR